MFFHQLVLNLSSLSQPMTTSSLWRWEFLVSMINHHLSSLCVLDRIFIQSVKHIFSIVNHLSIILARKFHWLVEIRCVVESYFFFNYWRGNISLIVFLITVLLNRWMTPKVGCWISHLSITLLWTLYWFFLQILCILLFKKKMLILIVLLNFLRIITWILKSFFFILKRNELMLLWRSGSVRIISLVLNEEICVGKTCLLIVNLSFSNIFLKCVKLICLNFFHFIS